ncbi:MAG: ROK family protein [Oscillospiraceae bacterium]|jgi:glucokinase|nr:ROK family protein [Oscillospiraceae bacterium]
MHIGIDLGGTNISAALVDGGGGIIKRVSMPTGGADGARAVTGGILRVCDMLIGKTKAAPLSVGIGIPGTVNAETGEVIFTPNLPLSGINIVGSVKKKYGCPVHIGNDANCAALGEAIIGCAKDAQSAVLVTLGTGVGGGVILNGRLHSGLSGAAGELGHMVIIAGGRECGCGRRGCWETYASATGLVRTAKEFIGPHSNSSIWELCGGSIDKIDGRMVFDAYRSDDSAARLAVEMYIEHLAAGIVNIINMLEPEIVCVGGGISNEWDCIEAPLKAAVDTEKYSRYTVNAPTTRLVQAQLGNDAGIIGAAMLGIRETYDTLLN